MGIGHQMGPMLGDAISWVCYLYRLGMGLQMGAIYNSHITISGVELLGPWGNSNKFRLSDS